MAVADMYDLVPLTMDDVDRAIKVFDPVDVWEVIEP
jgi:hypothetical protein